MIWQINKWIKMYLSASLRGDNRRGILAALLAPIKNGSATDKTIFNDLKAFVNYCLFSTQYNCQKRSLQALLNRLFDPSLNRIYLITSNEPFLSRYGSVVGDDIPILYGKLASESEETIYGYMEADFPQRFDGYVYVPYDLVDKEGEIKSWLDFNIFLGKTYKIIYI